MGIFLSQPLSLSLHHDRMTMAEICTSDSVCSPLESPEPSFHLAPNAPISGCPLFVLVTSVHPTLQSTDDLPSLYSQSHLTLNCLKMCHVHSGDSCLPLSHPTATLALTPFGTSTRFFPHNFVRRMTPRKWMGTMWQSKSTLSYIYRWRGDKQNQRKFLKKHAHLCTFRLIVKSITHPQHW